jgi:hypothetical protein
MRYIFLPFILGGEDVEKSCGFELHGERQTTVRKMGQRSKSRKTIAPKSSDYLRDVRVSEAENRT